ncbi:MAG: septum formation inhibitor Maf [Archangium sp.]|nr:septum formation inhibitor Maf [Archangium sp.]
MLTLASASPRRKELLTHLGVEFTIRPSDIDETQRSGEGAHAYVERLAREKAAAGSGDVILAADTSVVIEDEVLGKPGTDRALGASMLKRLSGRAHEVLTAIALKSKHGVASRVVSSKVHFRALTDSEIAWYVATGEGADKAGGYALQGKASVFITQVIGSPSNVIGLPLTETIELLRAAGVRLPMDGAAS